MSTSQEGVTNLLDVMSIAELRWSITDKLNAKSLAMLTGTCSTFFHASREENLVSNERRERLKARYAKEHPLCPLPERHDYLSYRKACYDAENGVWKKLKNSPLMFKLFQFVRRNKFNRTNITKFIHNLQNTELHATHYLPRFLREPDAAKLGPRECQDAFYELFLTYACYMDCHKHPLFQLVRASNRKILDKIYQWSLNNFSHRVMSPLQVAVACRQTSELEKVFNRMINRDLHNKGGVYHSPLDIAVLNGDTKGIAELARLGVFVDLHKHRYCNTLVHCIRSKNEGIFDVLIEYLKPELDKIDSREELSRRYELLDTVVAQRWVEGLNLIVEYGFNDVETVLQRVVGTGWGVEGIKAWLNHKDCHFILHDDSELVRMIANCTHPSEVAGGSDDECGNALIDCHNVSLPKLAKLKVYFKPKVQLEVLEAIKTHFDDQSAVKEPASSEEIEEMDEYFVDQRTCIQWPSR